MKAKSYSIAAIVSAVTFGLIPIFGQALSQRGISSFMQTFAMEALALLILTPLYFLFLKEKELNKKDLIFFILFGISLFFVNLLPLSAIALGMPIALVSLALYSHPIFTLFISKFYFKEKITFKKILYVLISMIGILILFQSGWEEGNVTLAGFIVSILGGFSLSLWTNFGRASSLKKYSPYDSLYYSEIFAVIFLLAILPFFSMIFPTKEISAIAYNFSLSTVILTVSLSVVSVVIGHLLFFYSVEKLTALKASLLILFEPITAILFAALIYSQPLSWNILIGGIILLAVSVLIDKT